VHEIQDFLVALKVDPASSNKQNRKHSPKTTFLTAQLPQAPRAVIGLNLTLLPLLFGRSVGTPITLVHEIQDFLVALKVDPASSNGADNYRSSLNKTAAIDPKLGKSSLRCVNATQSQQNLEDPGA
jgi:hypothetical protein